jgi:Lecithin:cholesterol acyltransferase
MFFMSLLVTIKSFLIKQALKWLPKLGKKLMGSAMGNNKGEVHNYRMEGARNIICMVHGFSGKARETFFKLPDLIIEDPTMKGWDVVSIGYASDTAPTFQLGLWAEQPDIQKVAGYLQTQLNTLLKYYDRVCFVAHSMGGLVVQRTLLDASAETLQRVSHVLLFGTPSAGLHKASLLKWYNVQIRDMDEDGDFIKQLRNEWNKKFVAKVPFKFLTVAGELDAFVPVESSLMPFDKKFHAYTTGNHSDMVKPDANTHPSYQILKQTLSIQNIYTPVFTSKELNEKQGDYAAIINELQSKINDISERQVREYIFALEGSNQLDEAIRFLENSQRFAANTDFLGILAGRYKRRYLTGYLEVDKKRAIDIYTKALELSQQQKNSAQIYYHAINLAFLHLHGNNDKVKMVAYAQLAMENTLLCNQDDMYEVATKAEACLYLNNWSDALANYKVAHKKAGDDIRAINSMYLNAFNACKALDKNDWAAEVAAIFTAEV